MKKIKLWFVIIFALWLFFAVATKVASSWAFEGYSEADVYAEPYAISTETTLINDFSPTPVVYDIPALIRLKSQEWGLDTNIMIRIIKCESNFRQFDESGNVLRSKTNDVGAAQIHVPTWGAKAKELGHDIYELEGNLNMAMYIAK